MTVVISVCTADRKLLIVKEDEGRIHVVRKKTDVNLGRNELHRYIVTDFINGNGGIFANLTSDSVIEAFIKPLAGRRNTRMILGVLITVIRSRLNTFMVSGVVRTRSP